MNKVSCGFEKWEMAVDDDDSCVAVVTTRHPNYTRLVLYDVSVKDLKNLGEMFTEAAKRWEERHILAEAERIKSRAKEAESST